MQMIIYAMPSFVVKSIVSRNMELMLDSWFWSNDDRWTVHKSFGLYIADGNTTRTHTVGILLCPFACHDRC